MADGAQTAELARAPIPFAPPRKMPVPYSDQVVADVCERIAAGDTLKAICLEPWAPTWGQWFKWLETQPGASDAYARARKIQPYSFADRLREITSDPDLNPQIAKLECDNLKWLAARLNPRDWGDSMQLKHADADGGKIDTRPLMRDLLSAMQPGANTSVESTARDVTPRAVREAPASDVRAGASDVSDLV